MDSKEMTGSIAKGIASFVLTILTLRGFRYVFSNNWLESIVIVVVATVVLYKWGVKWFGSYLWRRKLRTIGALICGFCLTTTGRIEADRRAKERYDARTNELKAEYDARTADGWGKDRAAQNFRNDAVTGESSRKNIRVKIGLDPVRSGLFL